MLPPGSRSAKEQAPREPARHAGLLPTGAPQQQGTTATGDYQQNPHHSLLQARNLNLNSMHVVQPFNRLVVVSFPSSNYTLLVSEMDQGLQQSKMVGSKVVLALAAAKLLVHLVTANRYGIFRG